MTGRSLGSASPVRRANGTSIRRGRTSRFLRAVLCVLTVTPLLRWAVVAHAVRAGRPWRRCCPRCATSLGPAGDLRALAPVARCGVCRQRLGPSPWTLELVAAASMVALIWSGMTGLRLAAYGWWAAFGIVQLFVDVAVQRLPARLSYAAAGGLLGLLLMDGLVGHAWQPWLRAVLGGAVAGAVLAVCALALPALVHWGDVRYALAAGAAAAWVGWLALYAAGFLATLAAALVGLCLIAARRAKLGTHLPQGPFLYCGTLVAVVLLYV
jgi:leader peptidase (prepilin peptidase)/N-methyltransferase